MQRLQQFIDSSDAVPLSEDELRWIKMLTSDWQILADLASADLLLWLPTQDGRFVVSAMCRSATAATVHLDDAVGLYSSSLRAQLLQKALDGCTIVETTPVQWVGLYSVEISCVPVFRNGRCFAVLSLDANVASPSRQSGDQAWTAEAADILCEMIANGEYPSPDTPGSSGQAVPRLTDGALLIDEESTVLEISPNANSAMRRLGIEHGLVGRSFVEEMIHVTRNETSVEETLPVVLLGRVPWRADIEVGGITLAIRSVPLTRNGRRMGAVLLTRDVTEQRRHAKQLMTKDATIREIHHRVKNNLQTVSALLRIQERRSDSEDVRAALREAGRRVDSIGAVHEALSQNVNEKVSFDEVAPRILNMAVRVATAGPAVDIVIEGSFGVLPPNRASALATVLTELIANSIEHGYEHKGGTIWVRARNEGRLLTVEVEDKGKGLPTGPMKRGLGTQIVQMMVNGELGGQISWQEGSDGGAVVTLSFDPDPTLSLRTGAH